MAPDADIVHVGRRLGRWRCETEVSKLNFEAAPQVAGYFCFHGLLLDVQPARASITDRLAIAATRTQDAKQTTFC